MPTQIMKQTFTPSEEILAKYAELIVKFGMQNRAGKKLPKGSVIKFTVPEVAKPLYYHLQQAILKNGHHPLGHFIPSSDEQYNFEKNFFDHAKKSQINHFDLKREKGMTSQIDGTIHILATTLPHALKEVDSKIVLQRSVAMKKAKEIRFKKINEGKLQWTIALYGTDQMAKEAGMSAKAYWEQIIHACYLDTKDPVAEWTKINKEVQTTAKKLTKLAIKSVHVVGPDIDLTIGIGKERAWRAGGGNNIPSYEVFTSPNYREVNGWAKFNQPHYRYGKKIEGIELTFKNGIVVSSKATKNHDLLLSMLQTDGGNRLGEFSLTDARLSRITKSMAEILFDENIGGKYGNTHVALGSAYRDCYTGTIQEVKETEWDTLGYNESVVHSDIISTTNRTVTATFYNGKTKIIYKDGHFTL